MAPGEIRDRLITSHLVILVVLIDVVWTQKVPISRSLAGAATVQKARDELLPGVVLHGGRCAMRSGFAGGLEGLRRMRFCFDDCCGDVRDLRSDLMGWVSLEKS